LCGGVDFLKLINEDIVCDKVVRKLARKHSAGFGGQGTGFIVWGFRFRVQGVGFRIEGVGFRVAGAWFRIEGSGSRAKGLVVVRCASRDRPREECISHNVFIN